MRKLKLTTAICGLVLLFGVVVFSVIYFTKQDAKAKVVTTIFPIYDMCREIMGTDDDLLLLEKNNSDMHSYNPTASDIAVISEAELFIFIGGESDSWVGNVIRTINRVNLNTLSLIDEVDKLEESDENILQQNDEEMEDNDDEIEYDEHIWLSPKSAIKMAKAIEKELIKVFPEKELLFKANADNYIAKLEELELDYSSNLSNTTKPIIVADRFPFRYLVSDYNLNYFALFSGCSAETEASIETIARLVEKVNEYNVNKILVLETANMSIANMVVSSSNSHDKIEILVIDSCQSIKNKNLDEISYIDIMRKNLDVLKKVVN